MFVCEAQVLLILPFAQLFLEFTLNLRKRNYKNNQKIKTFLLEIK